MATVLITLFLTALLAVSPTDEYARIYSVYSPPACIVDTEAPSGYIPVYVSHYGRHGSRYLEKKSMYEDVAKVFSKAARQHGLTDEGKALLDGLKEFGNLSAGHYGQLSELGAAEQKQLGRRLAARYPSVFSDPARRGVRCVSSVAPRCIMSMTNFSSELKGAFPDLEFEYLCGEHFQKYIIATDFVDTTRHINAPIVSADFRERFDFPAFASRFFKPSVDVASLVPDTLYFVRTLYCNAVDAACISADPEVRRHFTESELKAVADNYDVYLYGNFCNSTTGGHLRLRDAVVLVDDVVTKADAALSSGNMAADIRYGHDSAMMTFLSILGIRGYDVHVHPREVTGLWTSSAMMPMAANLQMVFYAKPGAEVLVKVLFNEVETSIPALGPGPYYRWSELRGYLASRMKDFSK